MYRTVIIIMSSYLSPQFKYMIFHYSHLQQSTCKSLQVQIVNLFLFQRWPTEVPELQPAVKSLFDLLRSLGDRVLCAMAIIGLGLVSIYTSLKNQH